MISLRPCDPGSAIDPRDTKVIVGMSGGVDSAVSAYLLLRQGYQVEGLFMKNWEEDDGTEYCTALTDLADAQSVADQLGIKLHSANFAAEYWDNVFEYFLAEYRAGRTPNPDILCNKEIKFKAFLDYALTLGADFIATGHYVRRGTNVTGTRGTYAPLFKGADGNKDQSYFLHAVAGSKLAHSLFPVGDMVKPDVRRLAAEQGFTNQDKKDSTGICFIGERRFRDFLQTYLPAQPGLIKDEQGNTLGEHQGLMYYTLGQRQGIGVGGVQQGAEAPWYVLAKQMESNTLLVGQGNQNPRLFSNRLRLSTIDWVAGSAPPLPLTCHAKTRYRQPDQACVLEAIDSNQFEVRFEQPQRAVTPGQSCVFYLGDQCLGGGVIEQASNQEGQ